MNRFLFEQGSRANETPSRVASRFGGGHRRPVVTARRTRRPVTSCAAETWPCRSPATQTREANCTQKPVSYVPLRLTALRVLGRSLARVSENRRVRGCQAALSGTTKTRGLHQLELLLVDTELPEHGSQPLEESRHAEPHQSDRQCRSGHGCSRPGLAPGKFRSRPSLRIELLSRPNLSLLPCDSEPGTSPAYHS